MSTSDRGSGVEDTATGLQWSKIKKSIRKLRTILIEVDKKDKINYRGSWFKFRHYWICKKLYVSFNSHKRDIILRYLSLIK